MTPITPEERARWRAEIALRRELSLMWPLEVGEAESILAALDLAEALAAAAEEAGNLQLLGERAASAYEHGDGVTERAAEREAREITSRLDAALAAYRAGVPHEN